MRRLGQLRHALETVVSVATAQLPMSIVADPVADAVETVELSKWIDDRPVLEDISFRLAASKSVALLGANGAGKSTLLRILATLVPPSSGELRLFGKPVSRDGAAARARIGLIGHQSMLYRDLSARQNLEFFCGIYGVKEPRQRASALLESVGLIDRADDPIKAFSRGMTQRAAIARALVHDPDLLLADEPFDGLDAPSSFALEELLMGLQTSGKTLILANHDIHQSLRLTDRTIVLREGLVVIDEPSESLSAAAIVAEMERP